MKRKGQVVITRPSGPYSGAQRMQELVVAAGYEPFILPVLTCQARSLHSIEEAALGRLAEGYFSWLVLLSPTAAHVLVEQLERLELRSKCDAAKYQMAVQGRGTASAVSQLFKREAAFVPSVFVADDFAREFAERIGQRGRVLLAQSADGRDIVGPYLTKKGFEVTAVQTYETVAIQPPQAVLSELLQGDPGSTTFVFMSPSAVNATMKALGAQASFVAKSRVISVGPITSQALRSAGLSGFQEASEHSEGGVLALLA